MLWQLLNFIFIFIVNAIFCTSFVHVISCDHNFCLFLLWMSSLLLFNAYWIGVYTRAMLFFTLHFGSSFFFLFRFLYIFWEKHWTINNDYWNFNIFSVACAIVLCTVWVEMCTTFFGFIVFILSSGFYVYLFPKPFSAQWNSPFYHIFIILDFYLLCAFFTSLPLPPPPFAIIFICLSHGCRSKCYHMVTVCLVRVFMMLQSKYVCK